MRPAPPAFALNIHRDFQCRRTGACCTAGWDITAEAEVVSRVSAALEAGGFEVPSAHRPAPAAGADGLFARGGAAEGAIALVRRAATGDCVFFDRGRGNLCAVHRQLGHEWLPSACRQFPRVSLIDETGIYVSLSHFCPTAAALLFRQDCAALSVVTDPPFVDPAAVEAFDARGTIPPFVRPGVVMDWESRQAWDRFVLGACDRADRAPAQVIAALAEGANRVRGWTPACGPMAEFFDARLGAGLSVPDVPVEPDRMAAWRRRVLAAIPAGLPVPASSPEGRVPRWAGYERPVNRYLAARAFGAWSAYQGEGLRTQVAVLAATHGTLCIEAARCQAAAAAEPQQALVEAIRQTDMLVVHLAESGTLVRSLGGAERMSDGEFLAWVA